MIPSHQDLSYFVEVSQTLNLSRAAERLGISQPSLTLAMQRLETAVGVPLLIRTRKGVNVTHAGQRLLTNSRTLLEAWERIVQDSTRSHNEIEGTYALGCHPSVGVFSLPLFLPKLLSENPKLNLRLKHDLSRHITEDVVSMRLDIAIVVNPSRHPDLVIRKLCDDEVTFWVSKKRKVAVDQNAVLICDSSLIQSQSVLKKMKNKRIVFDRTIETTNLEVVAALVHSGVGIGILPGRVATHFSGYDIQPLKDAPVFQDEVCLIYRTENRNVRAIQSMAREIQAGFDASPK